MVADFLIKNCAAAFVLMEKRGMEISIAFRPNSKRNLNLKTLLFNFIKVIMK